MTIFFTQVLCTASQEGYKLQKKEVWPQQSAETEEKAQLSMVEHIGIVWLSQLLQVAELPVEV